VARLVTVASQKGGVGKTTTAVNLAASLALAGRRTLLVDLDPQGNATSGVGVRWGAQGGESGLLSLSLNGEGLDSLVEASQVEDLHVIAASRDLSDLELIQRIQNGGLEAVRRLVRAVGRGFEFVIMDCPPSLRGLPTISLSISDGVLIPIQCEYYAMEGLSQILPVIKNVQALGNSELKIDGLILTMFSEELDLSQDVVREVTEYFPALVFRTIVPRDVVLAEASSHGLPAFLYAPLSRGAWSYIELAKEVLANEHS